MRSFIAFLAFAVLATSADLPAQQPSAASSSGDPDIREWSVESGEVETFMMPDPELVRDPHTLMFDGAGNIWFTAQGASRVGRLDMGTGEIEILNPYPDGPARPYGVVVDESGRPWINLFNTPYIATVDPESLEVERFAIGPEDARSRRIARTSDGMIWFVDFDRGYLRRLDPATEEFFSINEVSGNIRHMMFHEPTGALWFGTDANMIGRAVVSPNVM